ncbi:MAG: choice-of-anchor D domain-containing protein, partial [Candidatus Latescibacterota bacterium]
MTFTITNTGGQFVSGVVSVNEPVPDYSILPPDDEPYIIPGEDSLVVSVSFAPLDTGTIVCTINTGDSLCSEVFCTGIGYFVGDPDPVLSTVEPWDSFSHAFVCPGTGGADTLVITVLDDMGVPCAYSPVEIDLMDCSNLCIDSPSALSGIADGDGVVYLDPRVGGCEYCAVIVRANGFEIRNYPLINSADWDGSWPDGVVNDADSLYLYGQAGTSDPCADYDGNGTVGVEDFAIFHDCSGLSNTVTCPYACEVVPEVILSDTVAVGSWKDTTFTIRNTGAKTLVGTVSEDCPCDSILSGGGPYSIPGGDSLVVTVRFEPNAVGEFFCTVETGDSICADFLWYGIGVYAPPVCHVAPDSLDFGNVFSGNWRDTTFTIKNTGGGTLTGTVSDTCDYFSLVPPGDIPYVLGSGDSMVVTVRFAPPDTGSYD